MIDNEKLAEAAAAWIDALNSGNIDLMMSSYADDVVLYSPTIVTRWERKEGKLEGKEAVERHFRKGFEEVPGMRYSLQQVLFGVEGVVLVYQRETGRFAADLVLFNEAGKAKEVRVFYQAQPGTA